MQFTQGNTPPATDGQFPQSVRLLQKFLRAYGPAGERMLWYVPEGSSKTNMKTNAMESYSLPADWKALDRDPTNRQVPLQGNRAHCMLMIHVPHAGMHQQKGQLNTGATSVVVKLNDRASETQHIWPSTATARFLLGHCLQQLGKDETSETVHFKCPY
eukprot:1827129-Amphidinium_carterae.6